MQMASVAMSSERIDLIIRQERSSAGGTLTAVSNFSITRIVQGVPFLVPKIERSSLLPSTKVDSNIRRDTRLADNDLLAPQEPLGGRV